MTNHSATFGNFFRSITLAPAIGDWTTLQPEDLAYTSEASSTVSEFYFDSLPHSVLTAAHYSHYKLASQITRQMSADMNIKVSLHRVDVQQLPYKVFLESQTAPVVQSDLQIPDMGSVNVVFTWPLAQMVVDRLTGGRGEVGTSPDFTDLEQEVLKTQISAYLSPFNQVWGRSLDVAQIRPTFTVGDFVHDKRFSLREAYIVFSFYFDFGDQSIQRMVWAYPNDVLRALVARSEMHGRPNRQTLFLKPETVARIQVPVRVTLGKAKISLQELKNLRQGDLIALDSVLGNPISVSIADVADFAGQVGVHKGKLAVQLLGDSVVGASQTPELLEAGDEDDDEQIPMTGRATLPPVVTTAPVLVAPGLPAMLPIEDEDDAIAPVVTDFNEADAVAHSLIAEEDEDDELTLDEPLVAPAPSVAAAAPAEEEEDEFAWDSEDEETEEVAEAVHDTDDDEAVADAPALDDDFDTEMAPAEAASDDDDDFSWDDEEEDEK